MKQIELTPVQRRVSDSSDSFNFEKKYNLEVVDGLVSLDGKNFEGGYRIAILTKNLGSGDPYLFQRAIISDDSGRVVNFDKVFTPMDSGDLGDQLDYLLRRFRTAVRMYEYLYMLTDNHCRDHITIRYGRKKDLQEDNRPLTIALNGKVVTPLRLPEVKRII